MKLRVRLNSVRYKLFLGVLLTTLGALAVTGVSLLIYDLHDLKATLANDLSTQAELIGNACLPALQFDDPKVANGNLALLRARPLIDAAALYDSKGKIFGRYIKAGTKNADFPQLPESDGVRFVGEDIIVNHRIINNNEIVGTIYLRAHYNLYQRVRSYTGILLAVSGVALLISLLLSMWLQTAVTKPILAITNIAQQVVERGDYSPRAKKITNDELGYLADALNRMLAEIGKRSEVLEATNKELSHEVAERKSADLALSNSENRYRTLVSTLSTVVWVANRDWDFEDDQQSWETYTGQDSNDYRGAGWRKAFHADDLPRLERLITESGQSRDAFEVELRLFHAASSQYRIVSLRAVAVFDTEGEFRDWIGTVTDIDESRRAADEIRRLNLELEARVAERTKKLEEVNRELESFSYSVSHDLRAPLRAIDGFSQAILTGFGDNVDDKMRNYLERIRAGAVRMGQLIEDLLNLSKLSRWELSRQQIDLSALARQIIDNLRERDPERKVNVSIWDNLTVNADPRQVRVALENLLGNAWKFTGKTQDARVEFGMMEEGNRQVLFVRDNGAGFDMAYANKLFGAFQRLHAMDEFPGTGIGLATVHRVITRHDGRIWCKARPGSGATFFFTLQRESDSNGGEANTYSNDKAQPD